MQAWPVLLSPSALCHTTLKSCSTTNRTEKLLRLGRYIMLVGRSSSNFDLYLTFINVSRNIIQCLISDSHRINRLHWSYLSYVVLQHIFNPIFQCDCRGRTPGAASLQLNVDNASFFVEFNESYVAPIFLNERSHSCLNNLFDHLQCLWVIGVNHKVISSLIMIFYI